MRIQLFKNNKGMIHGSDVKRIGCDIEGTLRIGSAEISVPPETEAVMPVLFNGSSGVYKATFTSVAGNEYELEKVTVKGGRIAPPTQTSLELMELRCRVEALEDLCEKQQDKILELSNIFDTDSLNFLIH